MPDAICPSKKTASSLSFCTIFEPKSHGEPLVLLSKFANTKTLCSHKARCENTDSHAESLYEFQLY